MASPVVVKALIDGVASILSKINWKQVAAAALLAPILLFMKTFLTATWSLVGDTFGRAGSQGALNILTGAFGRVFNFDFSAINGFLGLQRNQFFDCDYIMSITQVARALDILSWWVASLLVLWFLRFVWWAFQKAFKFAASLAKS